MFLKPLNSRVEQLLYWFIALSSFLFFIVVIVGVLSRYVFLMPITWSIEVGRLMFIWSCFLAAALTYRKKAHIEISLVMDKLPEKVQVFLSILSQILVIAFMVLITYAAIKTIILLWFSGLPVLQISQAWFYIPVPIASFCIMLFSVEDLSLILKKHKIY